MPPVGMSCHTRSLRACCFAVAVALTGCASIEPVELKAEQLQALRSIDVVFGPEPSPYSVIHLGHPALALGLLGAAVVAADRNHKETSLAQVLQPLAPATAERLSQEVVVHLKRFGYDARIADAKWNNSGTDKASVDLSSVAGDADAVLVLEPRLTGFVALPGQDYLPTVQAEVRLYAKKGGKPLLHALYGTGWTREYSVVKYTATHPPPFKNFDALMVDPPSTAQSLKRAVDLLAERVAQDFKP